MADKLSTFERRIEILFLLINSEFYKAFLLFPHHGIAELTAGTKQGCFNLSLPAVEALCDFMNALPIPIPSDKENPGFIGYPTQKASNKLREFPDVVKLLHLVTKSRHIWLQFFKGTGEDTVPFLGGIVGVTIQRHIPGDSGKVSGMGVGTLRRDGVPHPQESIVDALLYIPIIGKDMPCHTAA